MCRIHLLNCIFLTLYGGRQYSAFSTLWTVADQTVALFVGRKTTLKAELNQTILTPPTAGILKCAGRSSVQYLPNGAPASILVAQRSSTQSVCLPSPAPGGAPRCLVSPFHLSVRLKCDSRGVGCLLFVAMGETRLGDRISNKVNKTTGNTFQT